MKKLFFLFLLCVSFNGFSQDEEEYSNLNWLTDFDSAKKESSSTKKPILMYFTGSDWCGPCKMLKKDFFNTEAFETKAENSTNTITLVDIVTVKKTKNGFKYWPYAIENSAIIYTNEVYKRIPEAISMDSITQIKNINRVVELYVPEEYRIRKE